MNARKQDTLRVVVNTRALKTTAVGSPPKRYSVGSNPTKLVKLDEDRRYRDWRSVYEADKRRGKHNAGR